jgi:3-hydroxyacyl-CoA dehydrogenase / enoyl-CoA hydratase / 3-hydroxybutyryl-CoA epimerase
MKTLNVAVRDDGVAVVKIDQADRAVNVFTPQFVEDLEAAIERILASDEIVGAVLTSGKKSFIAGADLSELVCAFDEGVSAVSASHRFDRENVLMRRMETGGKPFACALNGLALGGGLELALACHYRVLADDPKAVVGLPEVTVGLLPAGGGTQRLPRLIGIERAMPLLLQGQPVGPAQALKLGIVDALASVDDVVEAAAQWVLRNADAKQPWDVKGFAVPGGVGCLAPHAVASFQYGTQLAKRGNAGNNGAPLAILSAVFEGTQLPFDRALQIEAKYFGQLLASPVARNLMRTMFLRKGEADKLARRPSGIEKTKVERLGIVGAGMMGAGIAYVAARAGINVALLDTTGEAAEKGRSYSVRLLEKEVERGRLTREQSGLILGRIVAGSDYAMLEGADLVVEAVFEDRGVKAQVTSQAEARLKAQAVMASNTSTLMISSLAQQSSRPDRFIGMHFFSPVDKMPLVEIIMGKETSEETLARALDFVAQLKKTPIVVNDGPAFFTTRVYCTYVDEAMQMVADGISPALIENAAKLAGMPVGPLAVVDETSLELRWKVVLQAREDGLGERFSQPAGVAVVEKMVELGRTGRKTGGGFYDYPAGGKKQLWSELSEVFPVASAQPDVEEVRDRLLAIQALEAVHCLDEGVLVEPQEGDLGSILGVGFPAWTGGALSYVDTLGARSFVELCEELAAKCGPRFAPTASLREMAAANRQYVTTPQRGAV